MGVSVWVCPQRQVEADASTHQDTKEPDKPAAVCVGCQGLPLSQCECVQVHMACHFYSSTLVSCPLQELVEHYRHVSLGASFPGVDTPLLYPYWDVASKEVASSAGSIGLSRRTTAEPSRRPTSTSAITSSRHSPDQIHRASLPMMVENNSVLRRTSSGAGPLTPPTPPKIPISNGDPSHNAHSYCEAVYSFKAEYPGELSLQVRR